MMEKEEKRIHDTFSIFHTLQSFQLMRGSSVMNNVTLLPAVGDQVIHSVMAAVTSGTSDAASRTVPSCLYQPTQGEGVHVVVWSCGLVRV